MKHPPSKPKLIDENVYARLAGQHRKDYARAVKEYNRTGEKIYLHHAVYFENGMKNLNGIDMDLLSTVQKKIKSIPLHLQALSKVSGINTQKLNEIVNGHCKQLTNPRLKKTLEILNGLNIVEVRL